jgi:hypothetical protein
MSPQIPGSDLPEDDDRRYFPRWEVDSHTLYQLEGSKDSFEGRTKDLSCAGARIAGNGHIAPHQKIKVTIDLAEGKKVNLNAHILWTKVENDHLHMGMTFYDTPDEVQDLILQYAFALDKDKVVRQWYKGWEDP